MPDACCVYIVDTGYLFPTLVSAIQARAAVSTHVADIKIFCIGQVTRETELYRNICQQRGVDLVVVPPAVIDNLPIMFARFYITRFLDARYTAVLYIDGDTQISGSLESLLTITLEPGRFLAVRDPMSILIERPSREWRSRRAYFRSIGLSGTDLQRYFNSGVIRFNRADWSAISQAALGISASHDHGLRFPDQDALNLAFGSDYLMMSYKWNFPIFFLDCGFRGLIEPTIYHFMSNPRPWNGSFRPWGWSWYEPYLVVVKEHPELRRFHKPFGLLRSMRYVVQQNVKSMLELPAWTSSTVRERIACYEAEALI